MFFGRNSIVYTIDEPLITSGILDRGTVAIFIRFDLFPDIVQPLPITQTITQIKNQRLVHYLQLNKILMAFSNEDNSVQIIPIEGDVSFRYVIIPGGTSTSGRMAPVNLKDYKAVKSYYKIPD
ncbi:hypothetical protein [Aquiflexum sp.]|uniref:hypothetical protein n=1 Tax=Aquiflexum sp. TaxID=1872584 RepID=UPI003593B2D3